MPMLTNAMRSVVFKFYLAWPKYQSVKVFPLKVTLALGWQEWSMTLISR